MTAIADKPRDEKREAKVNLILQLVLFVPALLLFGFTAVNIVTAILFLIVAIVRFLHPTPQVRKFEVWSSLILGALWLLFVVIL
jgi:predicted membrane protein